MSDERDIVEMMKDGSVHELATALQAERARIRELEKIIHERDLEQQLADRDAAWEEAIQLNYDQTFGLNVDGFIVVIRRWIENKSK